MNKNKKYMKYCNVYGCMNKARSVSESGLSFFRVPNDTERRREWLKVIDREDLTDEETLNNTKMYSYVCSIHFDDSDIITTTMKRLKSDAVPTMFLPHKIKFEDACDSEALLQSSMDLLPHLSQQDSTLLPTYSHAESQTERKPKFEVAKSSTKTHELIITLKQESTVTSKESPPRIHTTDPTTSTLQYESKIRTSSNSTSTQTDVPLTLNKKTQTSTASSDKSPHKRKLKRETDTAKRKCKPLEPTSFEIIKEHKSSLGFRRRSF